ADRIGRSGLPFEHDLPRRQPRSIEALVGVDILPDRAAVDRHAGKEPACPRVTQDLRAQLDVGCRLRIAADGTRSNRRVRADLELVADEVLQPAVAVDDEDDVRGLTADLQPEAAPR